MTEPPPPDRASPRALMQRVNRLLAGHGLRWCSRCSSAEENVEALRRIVETGCFRPRKAIKPVTAFAPISPGRRSPWCRDCKAAYQRKRLAATSREVRRRESADRYERLKADPDRLAARRAYEREYQRLRRLSAKRDPNLKATMLANAQRYRERIYADPERRREWLENRRIDYRLRQERAGRVLAPAGRAAEDTHTPVVPVGPFADWLDGVPLESTEISAIAGVPERRLYSIRHGKQRWVAVDTVDRALLALGRGVRFADLYPSVPLSVPASLATDGCFATDRRTR